MQLYLMSLKKNMMHCWKPKSQDTKPIHNVIFKEWDYLLLVYLLEKNYFHPLGEIISISDSIFVLLRRIRSDLTNYIYSIVGMVRLLQQIVME